MAGRVLPAICGPAEKNPERTSRTEAIAKADPCAAGADDEDLVRRAAVDSAAVLRADQCRARWNQGVGIVAVVVGGSVRAALKPECGLPSCGPIRRPARALRPKRPPACSLAAFEPSLHFVDVVHALDDDAAGRGG